MAARAGAEFIRSRSGRTIWRIISRDAIVQSETLCFNAHGVAKYLLSRAVRDAGYKVVLTGEGSDEILGGYAHFRRDMLLYNRDGQDPATVRGAARASSSRANPVSRGLLLPRRRGRAARGREARCSASCRRGSRRSRRASAKMRGAAERGLPRRTSASASAYQRAARASSMCADSCSGREPVNQSLYLWSKTVLPGYILTMLGDRMEMAHSIEGRVPFLDHHVVEVVRSQPVSQKIRGMTEKYVLREAVRDVITDTVYRRQKHPFLSPPATLESRRRSSASSCRTRCAGRRWPRSPSSIRGRSSACSTGSDGMDEGARVANDQVLMILVSACVLQERFQLAAASCA